MIRWLRGGAAQGHLGTTEAKKSEDLGLEVRRNPPAGLAKRERVISGDAQSGGAAPLSSGQSNQRPHHRCERSTARSVPARGGEGGAAGGKVDTGLTHPEVGEGETKGNAHDAAEHAVAVFPPARTRTNNDNNNK